MSIFQSFRWTKARRLHIAPPTGSTVQAKFE